MTVAKIKKPQIIQLFENILWANSPKDWILKSTYYQETLFVSMMVATSTELQYIKIRRSYLLKTIRDRTDDIHGLAADCVDEMKTELKKQ